MVNIKKNYLLLILLIIAGYLLSKYVFVDDQDLIKQTLNQVASEASFSSNTGHPFEKLQKARKLAQHFTNNVVLIILTPSGTTEKIYNQDQFVKFMTLSRNYLDSLHISFKDQKIILNNQQAEVNLTVIATIKERSSSDKNSYAQELILKLEKAGSEWLIKSAENVELLEK